MSQATRKTIIALLLLPLLVAAFGSAVLLGSFSHGQVLGEETAAIPKTLWPNQCIDTMKYSRDTARAWNGKDALLSKIINDQLDLIAATGATCVALGTPYADEFAPFLSKWVAAARARHLQVWFRGNVPGFEGWFDYPKLKTLSEHHQKVFSFVTAHPELFADGDIFTPSPESENGLPNVWKNAASTEQLQTFLIDSYANCVAAFKQITKTVQCGYFSSNGDVAASLYTKDMVAKTGNVVVIDHYISSSERMDKDITALAKKYGSQVALGEFGAPIPDINGAMTEAQQADFIAKLLQVFYTHKDTIPAINYWVLSGGSTSLLRDDGSPKPVVGVLKKYFKPQRISGVVTNTAGSPLPTATVTTSDNVWHQTPAPSGEYWLLTPNQEQEITVSAPGYLPVTKKVAPSFASATTLDVVLTPVNPSIFYRVKASAFVIIQGIGQFMEKSQ